jgi:hypothetical protein
MDKALTNAVHNTLSYIEDKAYLISRKGKGGTEKEPITSLTFATFKHTTSRNLDPQLHVHCLLANVGKCSDGKYRSLGFEKLKSDMKNNKLLGQIFRNELALEVKALGCDIRTTILSDGGSSFELAHIHPKLIKAFSSRRAEIEELCKQYGVTTKEGRDKIVINSRKAKKVIAEGVLEETWKKIKQKAQKEIAKDPEVIFNEPQNELTEKSSNDHELDARELARLCVEDASYYKTVFKEEELLKKTLKFGIGKFSVRDIHLEINKLEKTGELIRGVDADFTTKDLLDKKKQILKYAKSGLGHAKQIIKEKHFESRCARFEKRELARNPKFQINVQQKKALKHILTSKDNIVAVEGLPGVGKSTVLNAVRDISNKKVINIIGLGEKFKGYAPTASAAKTLQESSKVQSTTLHSILWKYKGYIEGLGTLGSLRAMRAEFRNTIIFLDESSLVPTKLMWKLCTLQEKFGFRLVMTGDSKQLGAVESSEPYEQMLKIIPYAKIGKIVRQNIKSHREAIIAASKGDIDKTFTIHNKIAQSSRLANHATGFYIAMDQKQRENTLLMSPTRKLRDEINNKIRIELKKEGELSGSIDKFTALRQKDMSIADFRFAPSFNKDDIIRFNVDYKNGIEKGDYLKVLKTNEISNKTGSKSSIP